MSGVFDFINAINKGEKTKIDNDYSQYLVNIYFSLFPDTILHANKMNCSAVSDEQHYKYMQSSVRPRKRFKKWPKKPKQQNDDLALIMYYYKYSKQKAKDVLAVLTDEQIAAIRKHTNVEGN